ncbi:MAG: hypothetical protein JST89_13245 [Cyanobacteria bacterium SZAS-4]|nr:hypothetical protein [Cyanobacteria bacterium SZAS-4]
MESSQPASTTNAPSSLNLLSLSADAGVAHSRKPANEAIMGVLHLDVNDPMGDTPAWMPSKMQHPDPQFQCASTASNIYRQAMLASNVIDSVDDPDHRELMQVLVPNWIKAMKGLAEEIPADQIRPGDVVVGLGGIKGEPQNNDRHIGFVGDYDPQTQKFAAYSNAMGTLRLQDLDDRFGRYREEHFYRLYFPEEPS